MKSSLSRLSSLSVRALWCGAVIAAGAFSSHAAATLEDSLPSYQPAAPLTGAFTAVGDDDMEALMKEWVALFKQSHPGVNVRLDISTSAEAPKALAAGTAQLSFVGRLMLVAEAKPVTKAWGHEALPIIVAAGTYDDKEMTHAEAVFVHPSNPIRRISFAQLDAIFGEEHRGGATKSFKTWGDLGLTGEWKDQPIHALRYHSIGAPQFFKDNVLKGGEWGHSVKVLGNVREVVPIVITDKYAIGTGGLGYAKGQEVRVVPVAVNDASMAVEPTLENVANRTYPLSRVVYMYVNKAPGKPIDPVIREFLRVVLSREGQMKARAVGYLPLSPEMLQAELEKLD